MKMSDYISSPRNRTQKKEERIQLNLPSDVM